MQPLLDILNTGLVGGDAEPTGLCVAFSGGRDSSVLLHALHQLQLPVPLRAVYVDHGLLPDSAGWATHCETVCRAWQIPLLAGSCRERSGNGRGRSPIVVSGLVFTKRFCFITWIYKKSQTLSSRNRCRLTSLNRGKKNGPQPFAMDR